MFIIPLDILFSFALSLILLCLALMFLILMQQMVMMTKTGTMKMVTRMGMITWTGLANINTHSILNKDNTILSVTFHKDRHSELSASG